MPKLYANRKMHVALFIQNGYHGQQGNCRQYTLPSQLCNSLGVYSECLSGWCTRELPHALWLNTPTPPDMQLCGKRHWCPHLLTKLPLVRDILRSGTRFGCRVCKCAYKCQSNAAYTTRLFLCDWHYLFAHEFLRIQMIFFPNLQFTIFHRFLYTYMYCLSRNLRWLTSKTSQQNLKNSSIKTSHKNHSELMQQNMNYLNT